MLDNDTCGHRPTWFDRLMYYTHIIIEPCRFTERSSDLFIRPCLTADWIEMGLACPNCIINEEGDYMIVHPDDEDE